MHWPEAPPPSVTTYSSPVTYVLLKRHSLPSVREEPEPRHEVSDGSDECLPRLRFALGVTLGRDRHGPEITRWTRPG
jgi:hypothetical protein